MQSTLHRQTNSILIILLVIGSDPEFPANEKLLLNSERISSVQEIWSRISFVSAYGILERNIKGLCKTKSSIKTK